MYCVQKFSKRRNVGDWLENESIGKCHFLDRGYTGHEQFGFINMNARLYDPIAGQFSPDELARERPEVSPYSYCSNDPVNSNDPRACGMMNAYTIWIQVKCQKMSDLMEQQISKSGDKVKFDGLKIKTRTENSFFYIHILH